jgi:hypothetical protein
MQLDVHFLLTNERHERNPSPISNAFSALGEDAKASTKSHNMLTILTANLYRPENRPLAIQ